MDEKNFIKILRDILNDLERNHSVKRIGLFGSAVKGTMTEQSDIDVLVELKEPTFDHYMDLKFRLESEMGKSVDLVLADTVKPRLKPVIEKEVVYA